MSYFRLIVRLFTISLPKLILEDQRSDQFHCVLGEILDSANISSLSLKVEGTKVKWTFCAFIGKKKG